MGDLHWMNYLKYYRLGGNEGFHLNPLPAKSLSCFEIRLARTFSSSLAPVIVRKLNGVCSASCGTVKRW
jgi:hypothetical protein